MLNEMQKENKFVFKLFMGEQLIYVREFSADVYNHGARLNVNLKDLSWSFINGIREVLASETKNLEFDFYGYTLSKYLTRVNDRESGFKFVLNYNDSVVISRDFDIFGFKAINIKSSNFIDFMEETVETIKQRIKDNDVRQMWEEHDLINHYQMTIPEIRQLDAKSRFIMLEKIYK